MAQGPLAQLRERRPELPESGGHRTTQRASTLGLGLGVSEAALQGLSRNPLADPGLIGVSSGAA